MHKSMNHPLHDYFDTANEALHACIRDGDIQQLRQLLRALPVPNIDYSHPGFGPPLHFAACCGNLDAVQLLLAAGADPRRVSYGERRLTAIGFAALKGHRHVVKRLWRFCSPEGHVHGFKPYQTCLVVAATFGHVAVVEDLLDQWDGWSQKLKTEALLWAARRWRFAVVTLLLNRASFKQRTLQEALHAAIAQKMMLSDEFKVKYEGIDYLIALLIDAGADLNSCLNNTPLLYTVTYNANITGALKTLLEKGADPNKTNGAGKSALHVLALPVGSSQANTGIPNETAIRLLLQHGASVSQPDNEGECPLHWAAFGLDLRLFRLYLSSRPKQDRDSLLQLTTPNGETYCIMPPLNINAKNSNGWTPLMCALTPIEWNPSKPVKSPANLMRAAQLLLSHGAYANVTTDKGWTPLHGLALHCDPDANGKAADLTNDLIARGVDPEAYARLLSPAAEVAVPSLGLPWGYRLRGAVVDSSIQRMVIRPALTPLYWAAERGAIGVIRALLAHGVDVSSGDVDGISPARVAAESKFLERQPGILGNLIELLLGAQAGF
ncbi:ankyrin repeat protein [Colletotrichum incanum]|uniref:Ankyrin repeat protein n=1 Tax=Colletotrichum incanum TaxID=1573173 RepID=A0A167BE16_COLIC|nr:ankyrin repeat protein [Colletotrichum incanum]